MHSPAHNTPPSSQSVLSIILGGGAGSRLFPLTKSRAKPAVPLGANYRLIDIPVSNCINSGINKIYCLTQFNSASLNRHISQAYVSHAQPCVAPPGQWARGRWGRGHGGCQQAHSVHVECAGRMAGCPCQARRPPGVAYPNPRPCAAAPPQNNIISSVGVNRGFVEVLAASQTPDRKDWFQVGARLRPCWGGVCCSNRIAWLLPLG